MRLFQYGQVIRVPFNEDISTADSITVKLEPEVGDAIEGIATAGAVNVTEEGETLIAGEYAEYTVKEGDLSTGGRWRIKATASYPQAKTPSKYKLFTVTY